MRADELLLGDINDALKEVSEYLATVQSFEGFMISSAHRIVVMNTLELTGRLFGALPQRH